MAASLLPCPPSSNNYRMGQLCLHMHPDQLQKSIMCLSVHIQSKACNRKLYMIPGGAISDRHVLRTSASAGSIELDSTHQGNEASFSVWGPNDPQGSKKLLDCSRNPLEDTTDFEGQLQELFDEVKTMIKMGNENDAIDLLRANYEAVKEQMDSGARGIEQAATLDVIALGYIAIGDLKMVGSLLDVLDEVVDGLKDDELLLDSVLTHMGSMYSALGKFEDSMLAYRRSLEILEREYGKSNLWNFICYVIPSCEILALPSSSISLTLPGSALSLTSPDSLQAMIGKTLPRSGEWRRNPLRVGTICSRLPLGFLTWRLELRVFQGASSHPPSWMAKVLGSIRRATKAVEVYHRVITIFELSKGAESEDLVVPLLGLGNLLMKEGKAMDAEIPFMRILNIYTKLYGENDGRVGKAMCSLAKVKFAKGNADEAIQLYINALQVLKDSKGMPLDDNVMEKMRIEVAELLHLVGRGKEGRKLLEECLFITEKYKGKEHPSLVTYLVNLATSFSCSKNFVEAERLLRRSLQIMLKTVGPNDQSITFPMLNLAVTLHNLNQHEEAEQVAVEVLRIREKAFGKESLPVGEALDCLVSIQSKLGKDDIELLELLKRVLAIQEKGFGSESEEMSSTGETNDVIDLSQSQFSLILSIKLLLVQRFEPHHTAADDLAVVVFLLATVGVGDGDTEAVGGERERRVMVMKNTLRATCRLQTVRTKLHYCDLYDANGELEFVKVLIAMAQASMDSKFANMEGMSIQKNRMEEFSKNCTKLKKLLDSSRNPLEGTTDFEGQVPELFDEVKTMIKMGNENDTIDLLQSNYEAVKEQMDTGARGIKQAATLDVIALGYIAIGNLKMHGWLSVGHGNFRILESVYMLDEVVDGLKDDEVLLDSVLTCMGSMYSASGKLEDSLLAYRRSLEILEREYGKSNLWNFKCHVIPSL
ncbi:hypothetical protein TEA_003888 [Camellia sinensis var. sinensis]|uniref:MalT-like TPR region domain-containing protein n=1 Tax=Camellia sinensis var. sinensis TaxID=542762 RepID=A0A4V3WQ89_CAMSN|nr:hypothetical protein TEA_003888 [Camellia sinensis var. sinensis]